MSDGTAIAWVVHGATTAAVSAIMCAALIVILMPWLRRYALARPNLRSSHREPTPQGGGIAVVIATLATTWLAMLAVGASLAMPLATVFAAAIAIACLGAADDLRPLGVVPRFLLQVVAVAIVMHALPYSLRVMPGLPWWIERVILAGAVLWFVNLVNFMDGIDLMSVAEVVPMTTALAIMGYFGALPSDDAMLALALGGAMIGFAYFNRPTARLFLGDVGSLPSGLLLGWLLVVLAGRGYLAASLLLPLYYLADATLTLLRRLLNAERVWQAHRTHFYQRATDRGFSVTAIVARVFAVNLGLGALAVFTITVRGAATDIAALACGAALVAWLLYGFTRERQAPAV
jgi:UDP-N-acetylmuramyl pentapeptide phosphotransferase/UDP-N-acetylglucosamine-1-phosphate transferase